MVSIHPFADGNGRVARASSQWILYQKGFDPHHILSLDDFYAENRQRYYAKIQQARELDYDFTYWIEYVAEGMVDTMQKVLKRIERLAYAQEKEIILTPKQEELINSLNAHGSLSSKELIELLHVNRARINQLISPLVKADIIIKQGQARATRYVLRSVN